MLLQSSMIAFGSIVQLINGLWFECKGAKESFANSPLLIFCLALFVAMFTNMLGHVLFIERAIATIYASSYETNGKCLPFSVAWISILVWNNNSRNGYFSSNLEFSVFVEQHRHLRLLFFKWRSNSYRNQHLSDIVLWFHTLACDSNHCIISDF